MPIEYMVGYWERMREMVDKMHKILSMNDAARLKDLADDLSTPADKTGDERLIGAIKSPVKVLAAATAGYAIKLIIGHLAGVGDLL